MLSLVIFRSDNPAAGAAGELIDTFSLAMERQQTRIEALIEKVGGPRTGGDAFEQMTQMLTAMGGIMGAMGVTPQQPKSMVDQLTEWKMPCQGFYVAGLEPGTVQPLGRGTLRERGELPMLDGQASYPITITFDVIDSLEEMDVIREEADSAIR